MQTGVDRCSQLYRPGHGTKSIMRLTNRDFQYVRRRSPTLAVRELDIKVHLDLGQMVAVLVLGVVSRAADIEAAGLGPFDGYGVDIHRCATGDRDQQQLDGRELPALVVAERQRAAARIRGLE